MNYFCNEITLGKKTMLFLKVRKIPQQPKLEASCIEFSLRIANSNFSVKNLTEYYANPSTRMITIRVFITFPVQFPLRELRDGKGCLDQRLIQRHRICRVYRDVLCLESCFPTFHRKIPSHLSNS